MRRRDVEEPHPICVGPYGGRQGGCGVLSTAGRSRRWRLLLRNSEEDLLEGKAILADMKDAEGRSSKAFVQIDTETNQVMSVPTPVIGRNLEVLKDELKLSSAELTVMQKGEPLTLIMEDEQVTVGIDLNDKTGIRINQGDSQKWKENTKREWDKYTFGCYGCWVMGDDGNLDYVPEEEYTEELWNEQKKKNGERNRASFSMHKIIYT